MECGRTDEECECIEGFQPYEQEEILAMKNAEGDYCYSESEVSESEVSLTICKNCKNNVSTCDCIAKANEKLMSRVMKEKISDVELENHYQEREKYKKMYQEIIDKSWLDKEIEEEEYENIPVLVDEDSDEDSDDEPESDESNEVVDMLTIDEDTNEEDIKYNLLATQYNEDRKRWKQELGSCKKRSCKRNRRYVERAGHEDWRSRLARRSRESEDISK